jgi:hypothetical protein
LSIFSYRKALARALSIHRFNFLFLYRQSRIIGKEIYIHVESSN